MIPRDVVRNPVFVGGVDRSGTTMLGSMLGAAPNTLCTPESPFKFTLFQHLLDGLGPEEVLRGLRGDVKFHQWRLDLDELDPDGIFGGDFEREDAVGQTRFLLERIVKAYASVHCNGSDRSGSLRPLRWIDHTPANLRNPLILKRLFPSARFVHLVRDGRGVFGSFRRLDWGPSTPPAAASFWLENLAFGLLAEQRWPEQVVRCRYENLLREPESTLRELCELLDLDYRPVMARGGDFRVSDYTKHQHEAVGHPPQPEKVSAWRDRLSGRQIRAFEFYTHDALALLGYEPLYDPAKTRPGWKERYGYRLKETFRHLYQTGKQFLRARVFG